MNSPSTYTVAISVVYFRRHKF